MSCSWKHEEDSDRQAGSTSREGLAQRPSGPATVPEPGTNPRSRLCSLLPKPSPPGCSGPGDQGECLPYWALAFSHGAKLSGGARETHRPGLAPHGVRRGPDSFRHRVSWLQRFWLV